MGTHLRVLSESYPMNTNMTGLRCFSKSLRPCTLDKCSLSIGRVKCVINVSRFSVVLLSLTYDVYIFNGIVPFWKKLYFICRLGETVYGTCLIYSYIVYFEVRVDLGSETTVKDWNSTHSG